MGNGSAILKVLLIEDDPGHARLIREMLAEATGVRFDLECADRLSTGLARSAEADIDVLLLDLGLPDSVGFDTFARAYSRVPQVPIIVLTVQDDEGVAIKAPLGEATEKGLYVDYPIPRMYTLPVVSSTCTTPCVAAPKISPGSTIVHADQGRSGAGTWREGGR